MIYLVSPQDDNIACLTPVDKPMIKIMFMFLVFLFDVHVSNSYPLNLRTLGLMFHVINGTCLSATE